MIKTLRLTLFGPFRWYGTSSDVVFKSELASKKGIYLFTIPYNQSFLTYYVGETGKTFLERLAEHLRSYLTGQYHIYEKDAFVKGEKKLIFEGWLNIKPKEEARNEYFEHCKEYASEMLKFIDAMRLFVIPLKCDKRTIQRVEAAIAFHLKHQSAPVGSFQDEGIRYCPKRKDEEPIEVNITNYEIILGLTNQLFA